MAIKKVLFTSLRFKTKRASHRLRGDLIAQELNKLGYQATCSRDLPTVDSDTTVVFLKGSQPDQIRQAQSQGALTIYDVCDNKFDEKDEYEPCCAAADIVTANSEAMAASIQQNTGRHSVVIPDPTERPLLPPTFAPGKDTNLLWFGSSASLKFVPWVEIWQRLEREIGNYQFTMVTAKSDRIRNKMRERQLRGHISDVNFDRLHFLEWDWDLQGRLLAETDIVLIPVFTDNYRTETKSANRLIDGVMSGKLVITTPLASYVEFDPYTWQQDWIQGIRWAREHPGKVINCITKGQEYIQQHYTPAVIAQKWQEVINGKS